MTSLGIHPTCTKSASQLSTCSRLRDHVTSYHHHQQQQQQPLRTIDQFSSNSQQLLDAQLACSSSSGMLVVNAVSSPQMKKITFHEYIGPNDSFVNVTNSNNASSRGCHVISSTSAMTRSDHSHSQHSRSLESTTQPEVSHVTYDVTNSSTPCTAPLTTDVDTTTPQVYGRTFFKQEADCEIVDIWMPASSTSTETEPSQGLGNSLPVEDLKQSDVYATDNTSTFTAFATVPSWCLSCPPGDAVSSSGPVRSVINLMDSSRNCIDDSSKTLVSASRDVTYSSDTMPRDHVTGRLLLADSESENNEYNESTSWTASPPMGSHGNCQPDVTMWSQPEAQYYVIDGGKLQQQDTTMELYQDAATIVSQTAALDRLTVLRLRTECRTRRLPVSGRKRNLVKRLLPFADVILKHAVIVGAPAGMPTAAPVDPRLGSLCSVAPTVVGSHYGEESATTSSAVSVGSFEMSSTVVNGSISSPTSQSQNCGYDVLSNGHVTIRSDPEDMIVDVSDPARPCQPTITCTERHMSHLDNCNSLPETSKSICDPFGFATLDEEAIGGSDDVIPLPYPLRRASDGSLTDCWVRQQRLIEALRRQLRRYRKVLDKAKCSGSIASGFGDNFIDGNEVHTTEVGFMSPVEYESADDETIIGGWHVECDDQNDNGCLHGSSEGVATTFDEESNMSSIGCVEADSMSNVVDERPSRDKQPPNYYEAVKSLGQRGVNDSKQFQGVVNSSVTLSDVTRALCMTSAHFDDMRRFSIDDVIDVLTSSGELVPGGDPRLQPV